MLGRRSWLKMLFLAPLVRVQRLWAGISDPHPERRRLAPGEYRDYRNTPAPCGVYVMGVKIPQVRALVESHGFVTIWRMDDPPRLNEDGSDVNLHEDRYPTECVEIDNVCHAAERKLRIPA